MPRRSKGAILGEILDHQEKDNKNTILALKLQVLAWRQVALLTVDDPDRGAKLCKSILFNSLPFVNDIVLKDIIEETFTAAEKSSVFK